MGGETSGQPTEIPYELVSKAEWGTRVAATFGYQAAFGSWLYCGLCPRCGHDTRTVIGEGMELRYAGPMPRPAPVTIPKLTVQCQCSHQHGANKTGCGAYMNVYNVRFE